MLVATTNTGHFSADVTFFHSASLSFSITFAASWTFASNCFASAAAFATMRAPPRAAQYAPRTTTQGAAMSVHIDINCDMGESYGRWTLGADEEIMPNITSANIACGFHGGDPHIMRKTVELAVQHGVAVGAPPRPPGLMGLGPRRLEVSPQEIKDIHRYQ